MTSRRRGRRARAGAWFAAAATAAIAGAAGLALPPAARAASFVWDGGSGNSNDWSTSNNWNPNSAPPLANTTDTITFAGTTRLTPNLNNSRTIASLTFASNAGLFVLGSSNGSVLTVGSGGIIQGDAGQQTINHGLTLGASHTWNAAVGNLVVSGAVNTNGNTLSIDGGLGTTISGVVSGTGGITKINAATLTLSGAAANTYTGTTTVNAGTLNLNKTAGVNAIVGNLTIGDGSGSDVVSLLAANQIGGSGTITINSSGVLELNGVTDQVNNVVLNGGQITTSSGTGALQLGGALSTNANADSAVISGPGALTLFTNNKTFTVADGAAAIDLDISSAIAQDVAGRSITKAGAGTMRLSGANSFSGGLTLSSGTLILNGDTAAGTGTLSLGGGTVTTENAASLANAVNVTAATLVQTNSGQTLTFNGVVSGSGALTLGSSGVASNLRFGGTSANTHNGTITITNGSLSLAKTAGINAIGGNVIIGDSSTASPIAQLIQSADNQIANTATVTVRRSGLYDLATANSSETIAALTLEDGTVTTGAGVLTILGPLSSTNVTGGAVSTISGNLALGGATRDVMVGGNSTLNIDAAVSNGGMNYSGAGTLNLSAANTFAGGFTHGGSATVNIANDASFGTGTITAAAAATRSFAVSSSAKTLANAFLLNGAAHFALGADLTINGNISGAAALSKDGVGNLTLGGSGSTYSGATTVTGGKLIITANNALGATSAGTTLGPGVGLELAGVDYTAPEPLTINTGAAGSTSAIASTSATFGSTWAGPITLGADAIFSSAPNFGGRLVISGPINAGNFNVFLDGQSSSTYSGGITGTGLGTLTKRGLDDATLSAPVAFNTVVVNQGTLRLATLGPANTLPDNASVSVLSGATLVFAGGEDIGNIDAQAGSTIAINAGTTVQQGTLAGALIGTSDFIKAGSGTLTVSGSANSTYSGLWQVREGTLHLNKSTSNNATNGPLLIGENGTATPSAFVTLGADNQMDDVRPVNIHASGVLDLATGNRSDAIGSLHIQDGTVTTGAGTLTINGTIASSHFTAGDVSTISGNINLGGFSRVVTFGGLGGGSLNIDAIISNGGILFGGDNGTLNLTGANTFTGSFEHSGTATVAIGHNTALGAGTVIAKVIGTRNFSVINGAKTVANQFLLNENIHFALPHDLTLTGQIIGSGGISKDGPGTLTLAGAGNSFTGPVTVSQGKLVLTANGAAGSGSGSVVLGAGVPLELAGVNGGGEPLTINGAGGAAPVLLSTTGASAWGGQVTLAGDSTISAAGGSLSVGAIALGGFNLTLDGAFNSTYGGAITGGANVTKTGAGTATLSGTGSTFATLAVQSGTVRFADFFNNAMADSGSVSINPGATLEIASSETIDTLSGQPGGNGAIVINAGAAFGVRQGSWSGVISGGGSLNKVLDGTLTLSDANTFTGGLALLGGTVRLEGGAALADVNVVSIAVGAMLDLPVSETIGGLTNGGATGGSVALSGGAVLTVTGGGSFSGVISGAGELVKGSGPVLTLRGANTYTGRTIIDTGTIDVIADAALGQPPAAFVDSQLTLDNGGTLRVGGAETANAVSIPVNRGITIGAGGGRLQAGNADTMTVASRITGAGTLTIAGFGPALTMPIVTLSGANTTFTGKTVVDNAMLAIANDANLSAAPGAFAADKLTLTGGGTLRVTGSMSLPANRGVTILDGGGGSGGGGSGGALDVTSGITLTTLGPITGAGSLTKRGAGTVNLSTAHSYTGRTTIDAGTVIAQQDASFGTPPAGLVVDHLMINLATLRWTNNSTIAATRGVRLGAPTSTISVDAGVTMNVNSPVSGAGGLQKIGPGTLNLMGSNTYAGSTSVGAGRMIINQSFSTNTSVAISAGATLELAQPLDVTLKTTSVIATGKLDVKNNKVIITSQPVGTFNAGTQTYSGVTGMIASAYNNSAWSGNGMTTTMPAAINGINGLAVTTAGAASLSQFGGMSVAPSNVLVMYTYAGDLNLDGRVDAQDYGIIDNWVQFPGTSGHGNGDINYDGVIDATDYGIIDNTIQLQGPPIPVNGAPLGAAMGAPGGLTGVTAVPEPSALVVPLAAAAGGLLRRRRRRRRHHPH